MWGHQTIPPPEHADGPETPESARRHDERLLQRIKRLPPSVGLALVSAGAIGLVLPGPFGTPLMIAGGLVLAPKTFDKIDTYFRTSYPDIRHHGLRVLERFLDDMEKRYPTNHG